MRAWLSAALFSAALLAACASSPYPHPTAADVERGRAPFPDLSLSELTHGRTLYVSRCGACHALKRPSEIAAERWPAEVSDMRSKNGVKLSDAEAQAIVRYLVVAGSAG